MKRILVLTAMLTALVSTDVWAQKATSEKKEAAQKIEEMSKEAREKMAASHEKMAQCLRSDKKFEECHQEMQTQCMSGHCKGDGMMQGCPMMGKGMMKHHKKMMPMPKDEEP